MWMLHGFLSQMLNPKHSFCVWIETIAVSIEIMSIWIDVICVWIEAVAVCIGIMSIRIDIVGAWIEIVSIWIARNFLNLKLLQFALELCQFELILLGLE